MAVPTGFEPAISCVTGRHVKHHGTNRVMEVNGIELTPACKAGALPAELNLQKGMLLLK